MSKTTRELLELARDYIHEARMVYQYERAFSLSADLSAALKSFAASHPSGDVERDAERLDFIESSEANEISYDYDDEDEEFGWWSVRGRSDREWTEIGRGETLRAAIDAAIYSQTSATAYPNAELRELLARRRVAESGQTHSEECWRLHFDCAQARLAAQDAELAELRKDVWMARVERARWQR